MPFYRGMTCENVTLKGDKGTSITAYVAKPEGSGKFPGVVPSSRAGNRRSFGWLMSSQHPK